jgi:hypothetical protein
MSRIGTCSTSSMVPCQGKGKGAREKKAEGKWGWDAATLEWHRGCGRGGESGKHSIGDVLPMFPSSHPHSSPPPLSPRQFTQRADRNAEEKTAPASPAIPFTPTRSLVLGTSLAVSMPLEARGRSSHARGARGRMC